MKCNFRIYIIKDDNHILKDGAKTEHEARYKVNRLIGRGWYSAYYEYNPINEEDIY